MKKDANEYEKDISDNYKKNMKSLFEPLLKTMIDSKDGKDIIESFYKMLKIPPNKGQEEEEDEGDIEDKKKILQEKKAKMLSNFIQTMELHQDIISTELYIKIIKISLTYLYEWGFNLDKNKDFHKEMIYLKNHLDDILNKKGDYNIYSSNSLFKYNINIINALEKSEYKYQILHTNKDLIANKLDIKDNSLDKIIELTKRDNMDINNLNKEAIMMI